METEIAVLRVREVMSSPVITGNEKDTIDKLARTMEEKKIGSIVIVNEKGRPIGIVTDRDLALRVVGRRLSPIETKAKDIMSTPIVTIRPSDTLEKAMSIMEEKGIRRLPVVERGKLIGIISTKDIASASQRLITIISERRKLTEVPVIREPTPMYGYCDKCRRWSSFLKEVEGRMLCEECRA